MHFTHYSRAREAKGEVIPKVVHGCPGLTSLVFHVPEGESRDVLSISLHNSLHNLPLLPCSTSHYVSCMHEREHRQSNNYIIINARISPTPKPTKKAFYNHKNQCRLVSPSKIFSNATYGLYEFHMYGNANHPRNNQCESRSSTTHSTFLSEGRQVRNESGIRYISFALYRCT